MNQHNVPHIDEWRCMRNRVNHTLSCMFGKQVPHNIHLGITKHISFTRLWDCGNQMYQPIQGRLQHIFLLWDRHSLQDKYSYKLEWHYIYKYLLNNEAHTFQSGDPQYKKKNSYKQIHIILLRGLRNNQLMNGKGRIQHTTSVSYLHNKVEGQLDRHWCIPLIKDHQTTQKQIRED